MVAPQQQSNIESGSRDASWLRLAIVTSHYHTEITSVLRDGAVATFRENGGKVDKLQQYSAAGAFELPIIARRIAAEKAADAIILLGCVIRGETPHFEFVAAAAAEGALRVALDYDLPVSFGVLTTDTLAQARARAGGAVGNKGEEAALAAIETANLLRRISETS